MVKTRFAHLYYSCNFRDVLRFFVICGFGRETQEK